MNNLEKMLDKYGKSGESIVHYVESRKGALVCSDMRVFKISKSDPDNIRVNSIFYHNIGTVKQDTEIRKVGSALPYIMGSLVLLASIIGVYLNGIPEPLSSFRTLIYAVLGLVTVSLALMGMIRLTAGPKDNKTRLAIGTLSGKAISFNMKEKSAIKVEKVIMKNVQDKSYDGSSRR